MAIFGVGAANSWHTMWGGKGIDGTLVAKRFFAGMEQRYTECHV